MNSVEAILLTKIKAAEPTLDILGSDKEILQTVQQDFANYVKFTFMKEETRNLDCNQKLEQLMNEDANEFESFLTVWIGNWLNKWKKRVKLVLENTIREKQCSTSDTATHSIDTGFKWKSLEQKQEMLNMITSTLIKNGEICCTQPLAENILTKESSKIKKSQTNDREQVFTLLNSALSRAREIAHISGPLIHVKVDKGYFKAARSCTEIVSS